jgi:hypothetical protein
MNVLVITHVLPMQTAKTRTVPTNVPVKKVSKEMDSPVRTSTSVLSKLMIAVNLVSVLTPRVNGHALAWTDSNQVAMDQPASTRMNVPVTVSSPVMIPTSQNAETHLALTSVTAIVDTKKPTTDHAPTSTSARITAIIVTTSPTVITLVVVLNANAKTVTKDKELYWQTVMAHVQILMNVLITNVAQMHNVKTRSVVMNVSATLVG